MGIKLLFFTGFSKFVAHESVAFMFVLFGCYSRCLLIFFWGGIRGQSENPVWAPYYTGMNKSHKSIVTQIPLLPEGGDLRY